MTNLLNLTGGGHRWRFFRAGGFDQVRLEAGTDLMALDQLDQKLWLALACPASGLEFDTKTLAVIDTDKDGRLRAPEVVAAVKWAGGCLKNPGDLLNGSAALPLDAINDATDEGRQLLASARQILANLGKSGASSITVEDTADTAKIFSQTLFNGDGIVPVDSAEDDSTKAVLQAILDCAGAEMDRSGKPGVSQAKVDAFFTEAAAFAAWHDKAAGSAEILPLGDATGPAAAAVRAVRAKVDDYFARCRLAAFDGRAVAALNRQETEYLALAAKDFSITAAEVSGFPLARIEAGRPLPLADDVNPAWASGLAALRELAVKPLLGAEASAITEAQWTALAAKFAPHEAWLAVKAGGSVEKLGLPRVREILAGKARETIAALIAKDKALEPQASAIAAVEKLVRLHRDLVKLLNNFVSFRDFYTGRAKAIFQIGTLYLDQRACELCLKVEDPAKHAALAGLSGAYLAYCECVRKATGEKMQIVAAFTDGDSDNLMAGRNGVFYDRQGRDWDATITKIVDNPISIRQAFWAPYKKAVRFIEETVAKRAAAADAAASDKLSKSVATAGKAAETGKAEAPKPMFDTGVIAALGVAAAGLGGMIGGIVSGFLALGPLMPLGLIGLILLISGPSMILAWLKLRKRNLGPILDANGWAVNARARINVPFGGSLTSVATLPPGAQRDLFDPFAEAKSPWPKIIAILVLAVVAGFLLDRMGYLHEWSNGRLGTKRELRSSPDNKEKDAASKATNAVPVVPAAK